MCEFFSLWEYLDAFGQVGICGRVFAHEPANEGHHAVEIEAEELLEGKPLRFAEFKHE